MRLAFTTAVLSLVMAQQAIAQNRLITLGEGGADDPANSRSVTITMQMSVPAPGGSTVQDMTGAVAGANQTLYSLVDRECALLADVMKGTCRVVRFSAGSNYNQPMFNPMAMAMANRGMGHPMVSANINATFTIDVPKPANDTPAAPKP